MAVTVPTKTLPSGAKIPALGLGVYQSEPGAETYDAVVSALKRGYRHIDTAQYYENEADVGRAVRDSGIPREQIFVTSKLFLPHWGYDKAVAATRESNEKLGLGYIDLFLLHAPGDAATRAETWRALEDLQTEGVVKDIGISNFSEAHYQKLAETFRVKPALNQVELHPWLTRSELVKFFEKEGVLLEAYSPLAKAAKLSDPTVTQIASELSATTAQANLESVNITLTAEQVAKLDALDEYLVTGWDPIKEHAV
jgi:diketogulonate reductase-like aldo/keto reductase